MMSEAEVNAAAVHNGRRIRLIVITTGEQHEGGDLAHIYDISNPTELTHRIQQLLTLRFAPHESRRESLRLADAQLEQLGYLRTSPWQDTRGASTKWASITPITPVETAPPHEAGTVPPEPHRHKAPAELTAALRALRTRETQTSSDVAQTAIIHFAALITAELRTLEHVFTLRELLILGAASTSNPKDPLRFTRQAEIFVATHQGDGAISSPEAAALLAKLRILTPGQTVALSHALIRQQSARQQNPEQRFSSVGLKPKA